MVCLKILCDSIIKDAIIMPLPRETKLILLRGLELSNSRVKKVVSGPVLWVLGVEENIHGHPNQFSQLYLASKLCILDVMSLISNFILKIYLKLDVFKLLK